MLILNINHGEIDVHTDLVDDYHVWYKHVAETVTKTNICIVMSAMVIIWITWYYFFHDYLITIPCAQPMHTFHICVPHLYPLWKTLSAARETHHSLATYIQLCQFISTNKGSPITVVFLRRVLQKHDSSNKKTVYYHRELKLLCLCRSHWHKLNPAECDT